MIASKGVHRAVLRPSRCGFASRLTTSRFSSKQAAQATAPRQVVIPIFPLNIVALPNATVPIILPAASEHQSFFKALFEEPEPSSEEAPAVQWHGTKRFGLCHAQNAPEGEGISISPVGTVLEIAEVHSFEDGKMRILSKGMERFQISGVIRQDPVVECEVELLEEEEKEETREMRLLAAEVVRLVPNHLRLYLEAQMQDLEMEELDGLKARLFFSVGLSDTGLQSWLGGSPNLELEARLMCELAQIPREALELQSMTPAETSYFVASLFGGITELQQHLLQEGSTMARLQIEKEVLEASKQLTGEILRGGDADNDEDAAAAEDEDEDEGSEPQLTRSESESGARKE